MNSNHVFAKRLKLGGPVYVGGQWRWDRFAASTTGPSNLPNDPEKGKIRIKWPVKDETKTPAGVLQPTAITDYHFRSVRSRL